MPVTWSSMLAKPQLLLLAPIVRTPKMGATKSVVTRDPESRWVNSKTRQIKFIFPDSVAVIHHLRSHHDGYGGCGSEGFHWELND